MTELYNYNRAYELTVGLPEQIITIGEEVTPETVGLGIIQPESTRTIPSEARVITTLDEPNPLRIKAMVKANSRSQGSDSVNTEISLFNLNKDTQQILTKKGSFVTLKAGYKQDQDRRALPLVFSGQVVDFDVSKQGPDIITKLTCKDGYTPNTGIRVSLSFPPNTANPVTFAQVIDTIAKVYELNGINSSTKTLVYEFVFDNSTPSEQRELTLSKEGQVVTKFSFQPNAYTTLPNGYSAEGFLRDILEDICKSIGYVSYILDNTLYVHPEGYDGWDLEVQLNEDLIKSIRPTSDNQRNTSSQSGDTGLSVKTFLNGRIKLAKRLKITNGEYAGDYSISHVEHTMDYRGNMWDTGFVAQRIK